MIDGHGDDLYRYGHKITSNFSTNIPQLVNHAGLLNHLAWVGAIFKNYPEPEPLSVERKLAEVHAVDPAQIIVTNGATEAIYLLAHAFAGGRSAIVVPTFREYQDAARVYNHVVQFIKSPQAIEHHTDVVWLCNPNNPTGRVCDKDQLLATIDKHPATVFVIDQAYALFTAKAVLGVPDIMARENVVVLHSMTKQFVVPGLRIGYAIGPTAIIERLRALRIPWSVNAIAIEAAHYLLAHAADYTFDAPLLHQEAERIGRELAKMGIDVEHTDCNFILGRLPRGTAAELKRWLIENHGLLIRDASNFEGLTPRHFRVAAQSREENEQLINAIGEWISSCR